MPDPDRTSAPRLLLITGAGRSGTSTVAGALKGMGFHVPQPEVPADETNPRGFYEPQWVVDFHKRLLHDIPVRTNDARPWVMSLTGRYAEDDEVRGELTAWLGEQAIAAGERGALVVKDPRLFWFHELWKRCADDVGLSVGFLTMLRHPTEVAKSRDSHYLSDRTESFRRGRQTGSIAGWVNGSLQADLVSRGHPRAFVRYDNLMADWRIALSTAGHQLGIDLTVASSEHHPVDDFIDTKLNRSRVTWDDTETLPALREIADRLWGDLNELVADPDSSEARSDLDALAESYALLHGYAEAIVHDHTSCEVIQERRRIREKLQHRIGKLRRQLDEAQRQVKARAEAPTTRRPGWLRRTPRG